MPNREQTVGVEGAGVTLNPKPLKGSEGPHEMRLTGAIWAIV